MDDFISAESLSKKTVLNPPKIPNSAGLPNYPDAKSNRTIDPANLSASGKPISLKTFKSIERNFFCWSTVFTALGILWAFYFIYHSLALKENSGIHYRFVNSRTTTMWIISVFWVFSGIMLFFKSAISRTVRFFVSIIPAAIAIFFTLGAVNHFSILSDSDSFHNTVSDILFSKSLGISIAILCVGTYFLENLKLKTASDSIKYFARIFYTFLTAISVIYLAATVYYAIAFNFETFLSTFEITKICTPFYLLAISITGLISSTTKSSAAATVFSIITKIFLVGFFLLEFNVIYFTMRFWGVHTEFTSYKIYYLAYLRFLGGFIAPILYFCELAAMKIADRSWQKFLIDEKL